MRLPLAVLAAAILASPANAGLPKRPEIPWLRGDGNFTKASRSALGVDTIVMHATEGPFWPSLRWLRNEDSHASSHFIVSRRGRIVQIVHESDIAWHAGNMNVNRRSFGIEEEGIVDDPAGFTNAQYEMTARLAAYLARRWLIPIDRHHFIGHADVPDPFHPGEYGGSDHHTDPGPYWDWDRYLRLVRKFAYPPKPVHVTVKAPNLHDGQRVKGVFRWRAKTTGPVHKVEVLIDGRVTLRDLKVPFGGLWETRPLKNGRHTVALRAVGPRGKTALARYRVRVHNRPLVLRTTAPSEIAGTISLPAHVKGGAARRVVLYLDGQEIDHDTSRPFVFSWNSLRVTNGRHVLQLKATDRFGRTAATKVVAAVANPVIASQAVTDGVWSVTTQGPVRSVELLVDGLPAATLTAAPFSWPLDGLPAGQHALTARALGPNGAVVEATIAVTT